jgi:malonyl CoA-acyl carrier protein transacylase
MLPVSAPFHCPLMAPAAAAMEEALAEVSLKAPLVPVVAKSAPHPYRTRVVRLVPVASITKKGIRPYNKRLRTCLDGLG